MFLLYRKWVIINLLMVFYQDQAVVLKNTPLNPSHYRLTLSAPRISQSAQPGQFIQIRCSDNLLPLLRRPFGLAAIRPGRGELEVIYRVVGPGTQWLTRQGSDRSLSLIGPLGHGFDLTGEMSEVLLVAGGTGLAPLLPLLRRLARQKVFVYAFLGFKSKDEVLHLDDLLEMAGRVYLTLDDGSRIAPPPKLKPGHLIVKKGLIGDLFSDSLRDILKSIQTTGQRKIRVFTCGPWPLMKKVAQVCQHYNLPGQASLETMMGCGFGLCLGCAWPTKSGYKKICLDGPVLAIDQLLV